MLFTKIELKLVYIMLNIDAVDVIYFKLRFSVRLNLMRIDKTSLCSVYMNIFLLQLCESQKNNSFVHYLVATQ